MSLFKKLSLGAEKFANNLGEIISRYLRWPLAKPQAIDLVLTNKCNFHCAHCDLWQTPVSEELDLNQWLKTITDLRRWLGPGRPLTIIGGEPFLKKDFWPIVEKAVAADFKVILVTNGSLISKEQADKIVDSGIDEVRISLYSYDPEIHNQMRGVADAHPKAKQALHFLREAKEQKQSALKICLALLITEQNIATDALALINWAKEQNFHILIQALDDTFKKETLVDNSSPANQMWPQQAAQINYFFDQLNILKKGEVLIANSFKTLESFRQYFLKPQESLRIPCAIGYRFLVFNPAGQPFFCFKTGSINKSLKDFSAQKLWYSRDLQIKRQQIRACQQICRVRCYYRDNLIDKISNFWH